MAMTSFSLLVLEEHLISLFQQGVYNLDKRRSNDLSVKSRWLLCLCLCSLAVHLFVYHTGNLNIPDRFQQFAEHRSEIDHPDYEQEDDLVPLALASANAANTLASKTLAANFLACARSICPLLPPPKAA